MTVFKWHALGRTVNSTFKAENVIFEMNIGCSALDSWPSALVLFDTVWSLINLPYVHVQSYIRIGLWGIIIMTTLIVSCYKLPCTMCVRACSLTSPEDHLVSQNSWTTKCTSYIQRSLSFSCSFYHSVNCPQNVKLYSQ